MHTRAWYKTPGDSTLCDLQPPYHLHHCRTADNYWSFFKVQLEALGYGSAYAKRPSLHTSSRSGVFKADGCGLFFRKTTFAVEQVSMTSCALSRPHHS